MATVKANYLVVIEEQAPEGRVTRRMLVARFVAKGDAVAYAMFRRDTTPPGKSWAWVVETPMAIHSLYRFAHDAGVPVDC